MTQHFTTPEFVRTLKQHGIEIETPFGIDEFLDIFAISEYGDCISLIKRATYSSYGRYTSPAYPLTQVLGWLPRQVNGYGLAGQIIDGQQWWGYIDPLQKWHIPLLPIEALIIQGLTEGWLTKDNLNLTTKILKNV